MEEILKGQDDRIKNQINKLKEQDDRFKEQDQVIRELMKKIEQLENIASGRIAEVRSRSRSCNCITRTSQQECRGILENENRYLRSLAEMPALGFNFH